MDDVAALLQQANRLLREGRGGEAIDAFKAALAVQPDLPDAWFNLAYLQRQARQFEEALASYGEALARGVAEPEEVHLNRGVIFADDLARPADAEAELEAALRLNPRYLPALLNLGNLHEDRGEREAARDAYARALHLEPANALALARLAGVSPPEGAEDPLVPRLRSAIRGAPPAERAELGFALAQRLDAAGDYDAAFAAASAANQASRTASGARYDRAATERMVDRMIAAFPAPAPRREAGDAPIFICGLFRSGSTLAERILARHRRVTAGGELDILPTLAHALQPWPEAAATADPDPLRARYLEELRRIHPEADRVTDKRPDNFLHIGLIKRLFPDARIVHTVREPRDCLLSLFFLHLDPAMAYALDLGDAAHWYGQYRRLMAHWKALYGDDIHDLHYDALVAGPRPVLEDLLGFLGLDWEDGLLGFHTDKEPVRTASVWQVRRPLYTGSSGRWRNYAGHLGPLAEL